MSSGSSPTTYIPEPAAPTITRSVTPKRDYQYAANLMDKLESERKAIQEKTLSELTERRGRMGGKEDKSYRESLAGDEPKYTEGLNPRDLNTIASRAYQTSSVAAAQDIISRREREYLPVAGSLPQGKPPEGVDSSKPLAQKSAGEILANAGIYDAGEKGVFGGQDVDYLRSQGVPDDTIREIAKLTSQYQTTPAAVFKRLGGTLDSPTSKSTGPDPQQYARDYFAGTADIGEKGVFGGKDVDHMRSLGYTDEQIKSTAQAVRNAGQTLPPAVYRRLGNL